ncbi:PilZ domain-containing protein [Sphingomonas sp. PAMC 26621]|uniref:PilZ domain-containing protein n=1 Tax=Sphingomonas sp. PAMC 26621 TaxID=1112213 RepID=UPI000289946C|nr:PilZ domain-containing protein [Sphingomonas sp. PAMC 26621]
MMMAATLSCPGRAAHRIPAARPATLRNADRQPIDIFIENLSVVGFGMSTTADLSLGTFVSLQLAGIGRRDVRIVRRLGLSYGCEFVAPLDASELASAVGAGAVLSGKFGADDASVSGRSPSTRFHPLGRVAVLLMVNLVLWSTIVWGVRTILV